MKEIQLWKPVHFNEQTWGRADTTAFDRIAPSWVEYRKKLSEDQGELTEFMQKLKYDHSIETGIIEKLYDINENSIPGITVTLLEHGINSNFLQHGDTENPETAMTLIRDQYEAIDGIFSYIKNERPISTSFIKELHAVITRSQETTEAVTEFGVKVRVPLLRGEYKKQDNNVLRPDGTVIRYCPVFEVSMEMGELIRIYDSLLADNVHVIIRAAFFHHALTTIHPFQDGNGRVVRMLTSLILVRDGYFPFSVKPVERSGYLDALEKADVGVVQPFVDFIGACQVKAINSALNLRTGYASLDAATDALKQKMLAPEKAECLEIDRRRGIINDEIDRHMRRMQEALSQKLHVDIDYQTEMPDKETFSMMYLMAIYAKRFGYFMKKAMPFQWFSFRLSYKGQHFSILLFTHYSGQTEDVIAIGGVLEAQLKGENIPKPVIRFNFDDRSVGINITPLEVSPLNLSLLTDINETTERDILSHVERLITVAIADIASEI
ncbi:MAG: Fic family protein [Firmicutes bacterium]|nr:Fic family protein [Bacillota bacterium]